MKGVTIYLIATLAVASAATGEVCEHLAPAECGLRGGNCSLCKNKFGGPDLCFSDKVTKKLPARESSTKWLVSYKHFDCRSSAAVPCS